MPKAVDIRQAIAGLPVLHGRDPEIGAEEAAAAFAILAETETGGVFAGSFDGESPWERHRNGDELVQILEGETRLTILTGDGRTELEMKAGMVTVVPRGCWHKFDAPNGVTVMTMTPQPTDHTTAEDPTGEA
jgi:quercetin dioxygenase-like cupin family protein